MDLKQAGGSLDALISSFNTRIVELQELVIGRNMYAANSIADLSEIDTAVKAMEFQMQSIKDRLREETEAIPKAKKLVEMSLRQQNKLQSMLAHIPAQLPTTTSMGVSNKTSNNGLMQEISSHNHGFGSLKLEEESAPPQIQKEKKSRASAPLWYVTADELDSLSSYMRGRLTLDKVNAAINDMAAYAEANAQLISAPRNKLAENALEKALERRDIAMNEAVKGKHFFLETDIKGPVLKLDITGKSILTVLRHLGRINETRVGHQRVIILIKPQ
ncbi:hypothetical protein AQUCO_01300719v1 [Aquilegia coerulea]|uniref:SKA complex subunit 1 homolog n=1 Tax=Aquilegia coerulea TaxID=218851 RepID=A0A2G5E3Q1_AQUCA|nr:hypothetical protein AQUCO_01300719v1 [Aquilegia coerulea]